MEQPYVIDCLGKAEAHQDVKFEFDNGYILLITPQFDLSGNVTGFQEVFLKCQGTTCAHYNAKKGLDDDNLVSQLWFAEFLDIAALDYAPWEVLYHPSENIFYAKCVIDTTRDIATKLRRDVVG